MTVDLQADLVPGDTDNDGQIGLYEWRRFAGHTLKEFRELDRNDDGFVTPAEVAAVRPPPTPTPVPTAAAGATPATTPPPTNPPPGGNPQASSPSNSTTPPGGNSEQAARDAKTFFRLLDKNRDGQIAADEWQDGNTKTLFTKNGIDLSQPMSAEDFTSNYMRLSTAPSGG